MRRLKFYAETRLWESPAHRRSLVLRVRSPHFFGLLLVLAAVSACAGGVEHAVLPPERIASHDLPPIGTDGSVTTCASAKVQPAWIFKGACQTGKIGAKGVKISLGAYRDFTIAGAIGKTSLDKASPFAVVDAIDKRDIDTYGGNAFPKYAVKGSETLLYIEAVNGGTSSITVTGKPAVKLAIGNPKATLSDGCGLALLSVSKSGKFSWIDLPVRVKFENHTYSIVIPALPAALGVGPAYLALSCSKTSPTASPSPTPSTNPVTVYQVTSSSDPQVAGMTAGPDGNVWFTEYGAQAIGKITPTGSIASYPVVSYDKLGYKEHDPPTQIVAGSDGNLWFVTSDYYEAGGCSCIFSITPAGKVSWYRIPENYGCGGWEPLAITAGPDGNIWFTTNGYTDSHAYCSEVGRLDIATKSFTLYDAGDSTGAAYGIASGPDGNLWFTDEKGYIGRMTTGGALTKFAFADYASGSFPSGIIAGKDGNLWFTFGPFNGSAPTGIGRITTSGVITEFSDPSPGSCQGSETGPDPIVSGSDGNLWFGCGYNLAKSSTTGAITDYPYSLLYGTGVYIQTMAWGPDGNLWLGGSNDIAKFKP